MRVQSTHRRETVKQPPSHAGVHPRPPARRHQHESPRHAAPEREFWRELERRHTTEAPKT